jgi:hypothetical protein
MERDLMDEQELQAIEERCQRNQGRNDGMIRQDVMDLIAEVRRLRCCGNCRQQVGNPYFECAYMDVESYNESGCKRCSEWEAADNG